jgi:hypothetical protein
MVSEHFLKHFLLLKPPQFKQKLTQSLYILIIWGSEGVLRFIITASKLQYLWHLLHYLQCLKIMYLPKYKTFLPTLLAKCVQTHSLEYTYFQNFVFWNSAPFTLVSMFIYCSFITDRPIQELRYHTTYRQLQYFFHIFHKNLTKKLINLIEVDIFCKIAVSEKLSEFDFGLKYCRVTIHQCWPKWSVLDNMKSKLSHIY